jgi:GntR family transcriptional regulator of arabinose operon
MSAQLPDSKVPLYLQIRDYMKDQIRSQQFKPEDQIPTEAELMAQFGVSRVTVIAAIKQLVEEGLVYRISGKGTFVSRIESSGSRRIALLMPNVLEAAMKEMLLAIERTCRSEGFELMLKMNRSADEELRTIQDMVESGTSGLIIYPIDSEIYSEEIIKLKTLNYPFVLVDKYLPGINTNAVYADNYVGGKMGTEYLIEQGHRNIGILSEAQTKTSSADERFRGYLDAAQKHRLVMNPNHWLVGIHDTYRAEADVIAQIAAWLEWQDDMTAVFSFNRNLSIVTARLARSMGKQVPEDLSILSFDNPELLDLDGYTFSYIQQNTAEIGEQAVKLLAKAMLGGTPPQSIVVPVQLFEGRTTRPNPVQSE